MRETVSHLIKDKPLHLAFLLSAMFYILASIFGNYHLTADDFLWYERMLDCGEHCSIEQVPGYKKILTEPVYLILYFFLKVNPKGTNVFFIFFHLLHCFNGVLLALVCKKHLPSLFDSFALFLVCLLFSIYPTNYEILYWRSCIVYIPGMTFSLLGLYTLDRRSFVFWILSYLFYETFLLVPVLGLFFMLIDQTRKRQDRINACAKLLGIYGASLLFYFVFRKSGPYLFGGEALRYSIDWGQPFGVNILLRLFRYLGLFLSMRSSQTKYELLTAVFILSFLVIIYKNRDFIRKHWLSLSGLVMVFLLNLGPVSVVSHSAPRGAFGASVMISILLAALLRRGNTKLISLVLLSCLAAQTAGVYRTSFNSQLYESRLTVLETKVLDQYGIVQKNFVVKGMSEGMYREWFLQFGFWHKCFEKELNERMNIASRLYLKCPENIDCTVINL